jgi:hypothetical protein
MALSARFSLLHSELNEFLFASIGTEENGAPLSVLSALTRLGIDPWEEGARLANLPADAAARALVPMIAQFPTADLGVADIPGIAQRLAALLPRHIRTTVTVVRSKEKRWQIGWPPLWLVGLALAALLLSSLLAHGMIALY